MSMQQFFSELWPNANKQLVAESAKQFATLANKYGYTTQASVVSLLGNINLESGRATKLIESLNYKPARMFEIFGVGNSSAKLTRAECNQLAGDQKATAMRVYGTGGLATILGNKSPIDGWNFRGQGLGQTTGRYNFEQLAKRTGLDVVNNPGMVTAPATALMCTMANYAALGVPAAANRSFESSVYKINTKGLHMADRKSEGARALKLMNKYGVMAEIAAAGKGGKPAAAASKATVEPVPVAAPVETDPVETPVEVAATTVAPVTPPVTTSPVVATTPPDPILLSLGDNDKTRPANATGPTVRQVQHVLNENMFVCGEEDGDFASRVSAAQFLMETQNGLIPDGKVSQSDWDYMNSDRMNPAVVTTKRAETTEVTAEAKNPAVGFAAAISRWGKRAIALIVGGNVVSATDPLDQAKALFDNYDGVKTNIGRLQEILSYVWTPTGISILALLILAGFAWWATRAVKSLLKDIRSGKLMD